MAGRPPPLRPAGLGPLAVLLPLSLAVVAQADSDWDDLAPTWPEDWSMLHRVVLVASLAVFSVCVWCVACCMFCHRVCSPAA
ncbi:unnamed protein product, partial [Prorocentrum cordatum]